MSPYTPGLLSLCTLYSNNRTHECGEMKGNKYCRIRHALHNSVYQLDGPNFSPAERVLRGTPVKSAVFA